MLAGLPSIQFFSPLGCCIIKYPKFSTNKKEVGKGDDLTIKKVSTIGWLWRDYFPWDEIHWSRSNYTADCRLPTKCLLQHLVIQKLL